MVEVRVVYEGQLHCRATHGPSGAQVVTDAPTDNGGKGELFSPTDLVGAAMATCMLTIMGLIAQRHNIDITGATATVEKHMSTTGPRRIARLPVLIKVPQAVSAEDRQKLEQGALSCPVHKSLHPDIDAAVTFEWGESR